jgi:CHAD domain-containing protein
VCEAARRSLQVRLAAVIRYLPLAAYYAGQDVEHVHRLRVSTRRAVAALKLYCDVLPRKQARWVQKQLKRIRRTAGQARDLDVLAERLGREHGERAAPILAEIGGARAAVQPAITRLAKRMSRRDRLVRKTAKLVEGIGAPQGSDQMGLGGCFRDWARARLADAVAGFFAAQPPDHADLASLHKFRIRGKALRYAVELLAPAFGNELRTTHYPVIEELQERLGKINDRATARNQLLEWAAELQDFDQHGLFCEAADLEMAQLIDELAAFSQWWTPQRRQQLAEGLRRHTDAKR